MAEKMLQDSKSSQDTYHPLSLTSGKVLTACANDRLVPVRKLFQVLV